ncbi:anion permease [Edwardsiella hoshinae]|uniref:Tartrate transporter n=1 Tax=Edwardsiella hoshinae TaxID=93378 RepID=A0A376DM70_9GAMM|nr:anion permease [Edwardsiella hoshinae]QPR28921.1 anion permease [Edwardsiella hoshinae]STC91818.1 Tartrate transporter [Edwardsiella hoshinae]
MKKGYLLLIPFVVGAVLACLPAPAGLSHHAWLYFAIFIGSIVGLILEPLPGAVIGLMAVVIIAGLGRWVLFSPEQLTAAHFHATSAAFKWAVSGFSNSTVWLIFSAFMFALGYEKTGLGRRISLMLVKSLGRRSLTLGYAIAIADLVLAPFTPSNTARSAGTIYPVISNLPPLYDSKPNDPSARRIGSYLMWVSISITCVTSSMFLSALAPNLLSSALINQMTGLQISWGSWFIAFLPCGIVLWLLTPLLGYWLYTPEVKVNDDVPKWAKQELANLGGLSQREKLLLVFVILALLLWVFGSGFINSAIAALLVIALMLVSNVITWDDVIGNKAAWNTLFWFGTLVSLASGLSAVGFVHWFGLLISQYLNGMSVDVACVSLLLCFYLLHYFFASTTAHATALVPVMIAAAMDIHGINMMAFSLAMSLSLGIMGIITPYGTGPSPIYFGSGYLPSKDFWRLGAIFGLVNLLAYLFICLPWINYLYR